MKLQNSFFLQIILSMLLAAILYLPLAYYFTGLDETLLWMAEVNLSKENSLSKIHKSKILINGGSATLFGLSAKKMSNELSLPTYNLASSVELGLQFFLDQSQQQLKKGDSLLLIPEYELFDDKKSFTKRSFNYHRIFKGINLRNIPLEEIPFLLEIVFFQHPIDSFFQYLQYKNAAPGSTGYGSKNMDEYGDQTHMPQRFYEGSSIDFGQMKNSSLEGIPKIKKFYEWCKSQNVKFYVSFPNTLAPDHKNLHESHVYFSHLVKQLQIYGIPFLGTPQDFLFPRSLFSDTVYHLNRRGIDIRTKRMIDLLERHRDFLPGPQGP